MLMFKRNRNVLPYPRPQKHAKHLASCPTPIVYGKEADASWSSKAVYNAF